MLSCMVQNQESLDSWVPGLKRTKGPDLACHAPLRQGLPARTAARSACVRRPHEASSASLLGLGRVTAARCLEKPMSAIPGQY